MIYIINNDGYRLCNDDRWRTFAMFGTPQSTVKLFRVMGWAIKKAKRLKARVVELPDDVTVDAAGNLSREVPTKPGFHRVEHPSVEEFVVHDFRENKIGEEAA